MQTLFYNGAKNFWVHGTGPLGCLPQKLAEARNDDDGDLDDSGCLRTLNNASYEFNDQLCSVCHKLTSQLKGATIVYTDILPIKYDLIANHSGYGESIVEQSINLETLHTLFFCLRPGPLMFQGLRSR